MIGWRTQTPSEPIAVVASPVPTKPRYRIELTRVATHRVVVEVAAVNAGEAEIAARYLAGGDCRFWDSVEWGDLVVESIEEPATDV